MYLVVCTVEHNAGVLSSTGHVFRDVRLSSGRENVPGRTYGERSRLIITWILGRYIMSNIISIKEAEGNSVAWRVRRIS